MKKRPVQGTNGTSSPLVPFPRSHAPAWECIRRYWLTPVWVPTQERGNQKVSHFEVEFANTPSSPRRQESTPSPVIPAQAGIHPITRHSHEGGNPQFPHMREFNEKKTSSRPTRHLIPTQDYLNVIPAKAGMTEYFFGRWGSGPMNSRVRGNCGFPPSRE